MLCRNTRRLWRGRRKMASVLDQALAASDAIDKKAAASPVVAGATAAAAQDKAVKDEAAKKLEGLQDKYSKLADTIDDGPPVPKADIQELPDAPKSKDYLKDPTRVFGQFMPLLVSFGALATRNGGVNALKAATAAMTASKEGDQEKLEQAHKDWMDATKKVLDHNSMEVEKRNEILNDRKMSVEEKVHRLNMLGVEMQNTTALATLRGGNLGAYADQTRTLKEAADPIRQIYEHAQTQQLEQERLSLERQKAKEEAGYHQEQLAIDREKVPVANQVYMDHLKQHPGDTEGAARAAASATTEMHPARSASAMALRAFMEQHPDATPEEIVEFSAHQTEVAKAARDFGTGKQGQQLNSFNVALTHLDTLGDLAAALGNGNTQALNRVGQTFQQQFGSAAPTNFDAAKRIVGDEIVKAIVGGGGGVAEREKAGESVARANSPQQLAGVIDTYKTLMAGQLHGLRQQYKSTTGGTDDDFDARLSPEAREYVNRAKSSGLPLPARKEDAKVGEIYQTARGPAKWTGDHFELVH